MKRVLLLTLLAGIGLLCAAGPAAAAQPCWKRLINDWYDGRIDKIYPVTCYREAMKHAGEDAKEYSTLPEDLTRALQSAIQTGRGNPVVPAGAKGRDLNRKQQIRPKGNSKRNPKRTSKAKDHSKIVPGVGRDTQPPTGLTVGPQPGRQKPKGFFTRALDTIGPNNASSIPLPLIFLAALALVLTAAGAAGMVTRRVQARRIGGDPDLPPTDGSATP